ncbi:hypothetical protein [Sinomonas humi]|uniref:Uncharacterized protein n=1 Tax=Sinomonas humi TaxID=1338436 RepID=A0A0B2ARA9_9MICC|nr:hypothetical protein [Sinomonas humi]KHL04408.1 hypothetical protein LK10_05820 [Sinomonas humi]
MRALFRLSRAVVVSSSTVLLAAGGHLAGGGSLPDPLVVVGILALVTLPVMALAGRKISPPMMFAILGVGQFGLHNAFEVLSASASSASTLSVASGHVHLMGAISKPAHAAPMAMDTGHMLLAHAIATVLTALLLAHGESAVWALLAWLRPLIRLLVAASPSPEPHVPAFIEDALPRAWRSLRLPARRGPPRAFAVA